MEMMNCRLPAPAYIYLDLFLGWDLKCMWW